MADNRRDIELIIRASNLASKPFKEVATSIEGITHALDGQIAAAKKGEITASELRDTFRQLEQAGAALIKQQGIVDLYGRIAQQLDAAQEKAAAAKVAHEALAASQASQEKVTRQEERALTALAKASEAAERRVQTLQASLAIQSEKAAQAGLDTSNLARTQEQITTAAQRAGGALTKVDAALTSYNASLRATKSEQAQLNQELEAADKLAAFRKLGTDAEASAASLDRLTTAEVRGAAETSRLAATLHAVLDPAAAAVTTLSGLEGRVEAVATEVGAGTKPIYAYTNAINELSRVQSALLGQAKDIDAFRNQEAAVERASLAYTEARQRVLQLSAAIRTADAPSEQLAADLNQARSALVSSSRELDNERTKLDRLAVSLRKAGIETGSLDDAERRLAASAKTAASASEKLDKVASGQSSKAGRFLGLRPYELQNLSFQINDIVTGIISGQRPLQVVAQQGGQLIQIFPQLLTGLIRFLPIVGAASAALFTLFETFRRAGETAELVRKFNGQLLATADASTLSAREMARATRSIEDYGSASADAVQAVKEFNQHSIDPQRFAEFGRTAQDAADVLGIKMPDAAGKMAEAFSGGYAQVKALDDQFNFLTAAERVQIKAMFDSGDAARARTEAFRIFQRQMKEGADAMRGPLTEALRNFSDAWKNFLDFLGSTSVVRDTIDQFRELASLAERVSKLLPGAGRRELTGGNRPAGGGLPLVQRNPNPLAPLGGIVPFGGVLGGLFGANSVKLNPEIDAIVRTAIGEARKGDRQGMQAVAAVILNRMERSGLTAQQIVTSPGQFQSWTDMAKSLQSIDRNSAQYKQALEAVLPILEARVADPTGGAVNFFSPAGQVKNVAAGRSRSLIPDFANPDLKTGSIGGQEFFRGTFPGDRQRQAGQPTEQQLKAGRDYVDELLEQFDAVTKVSDAERIRLAGIKALREAQERGADEGFQIQAQKIAEETERWKVVQERAQQARQLAQELVSASTQAAEGQAASLQTRLDAITRKFEVFYAKVQEAKTKGLTDVNGLTLDSFIKQLQAQERILKQQEQMKFLEEQLALIEKQRAEEIKTIQARLSDSQIQPAAAVAAISEVNSRLLPKMREVAKQAADFATSVRSATPDPKLEAFIASMRGAETQAIGGAVKESLKIFDDAEKGLQGLLEARLQGINDLAAQGTADGVEAFKQAQDAVKELAPQIEKLASDAIAFAKGIQAAHPSPELANFIADMERVRASAANTRSERSPARLVGDTQAQREESKLNDILAQRNTIISYYQQLVDRGQLSQFESQKKIAETFNQFGPIIKAQVDELQTLIDRMHEAGVISDELFASWEAKLQSTVLQSQYVDENFLKIRDTIIGSFVSGVVSAFDQVAQALGNVINGTGTFKDLLETLGQAALGFVSSLLKAVADMVVQLLALKLIMSLPFLNGLTKGITDFSGLTTGATVLAVAGGIVNSASTKLTAGASELLAAGAVVAAAAIQMQSAAAALTAAGGITGGGGGGLGFFGAILGGISGGLGGIGGGAGSAVNVLDLFHEGGMVGRVGGLKRQVRFNPLLLGSVPRYHSGTPGVGLSADEQLAVLKKREEVLSENDPRNARNAGRGRRAGAPGDGLRVKNINLIDPASFISEALNTVEGERVVMNFISKRPAAFKAALGITK